MLMQAPTLLSTAVTQYKQRMNAQGLHVRSPQLPLMPFPSPEHLFLFLFLFAFSRFVPQVSNSSGHMLAQKSALQVWNWSEVHSEWSAEGAAEGAAGDRYYGGAGAESIGDSEISLSEILAESVNQGGAPLTERTSFLRVHQGGAQLFVPCRCLPRGVP